MLAKTIHFYVLWPLSQIFKMIKYFRLIPIMNLVYIIVFTLHIFNFEGGSKSANGGPYILVGLDPRGSISTSRFGPGGPNLLVDMDRGSKSTGVQINWDTGPGQNSGNLAGDFKLKFVKFFLLLSYNCQDSGNLSKTKN